MLKIFWWPTLPPVIDNKSKLPRDRRFKNTLGAERCCHGIRPLSYLINTSAQIKDAGDADDGRRWCWVVQATLHLLPSERGDRGRWKETKTPGPSSGVFSFDPWTDNSEEVTSASHLTSFYTPALVHATVIMQTKCWHVGQGSPCRNSFFIDSLWHQRKPTRNTRRQRWGSRRAARCVELGEGGNYSN